MPDIDMDFDERFRGDMIRYAAERYGSDHVAQIVTFSTIKARAAVRDAARVLGYPPQLGDKIAKAMPPLVMGQDLPLEACFQPTPGYEGRFVEAAELRGLYENDAEVKHSIDVAMGFVDKRRQDGIHARRPSSSPRTRCSITSRYSANPVRRARGRTRRSSRSTKQPPSRSSDC